MAVDVAGRCRSQRTKRAAKRAGWMDDSAGLRLLELRGHPANRHVGGEEHVNVCCNGEYVLHATSV